MIKNLTVALLLGIVTIENVKARKHDEDEGVNEPSVYYDEESGPRQKSEKSTEQSLGESQIAKLVHASRQGLKDDTQRSSENSEDIQDLKDLIQDFNTAHAEDPYSRRTQKLEQKLALAIEDQHAALKKARKGMEKLSKSGSKGSKSKSKQQKERRNQSSDEDEEEGWVGKLMNMVGMGPTPAKVPADPHSPEGLGVPKVLKYIKGLKQIKEADKVKFKNLNVLADNFTKAFAKEAKGKATKQLEEKLVKAVEALKKIDPKLPGLGSKKKEAAPADPFSIFETEPFFTAGKKPDVKDAKPAKKPSANSPSAKAPQPSQKQDAKSGQKPSAPPSKSPSPVGKTETTKHSSKAGQAKTPKEESKKSHKSSANGKSKPNAKQAPKQSSPGPQTGGGDPFSIFKTDPFFSGGDKPQDKKPENKSKVAATPIKKPNEQQVSKSSKSAQVSSKDQNAVKASKTKAAASLLMDLESKEGVSDKKKDSAKKGSKSKSGVNNKDSKKIKSKSMSLTKDTKQMVPNPTPAELGLDALLPLLRSGKISASSPQDKHDLKNLGDLAAKYIKKLKEQGPKCTCAPKILKQIKKLVESLKKRGVQFKIKGALFNKKYQSKSASPKLKKNGKLDPFSVFSTDPLFISQKKQSKEKPRSKSTPAPIKLKKNDPFAVFETDPFFTGKSSSGNSEPKPSRSFPSPPPVKSPSPKRLPSPPNNNITFQNQTPQAQQQMTVQSQQLPIQQKVLNSVKQGSQMILLLQ